MLSKTITVMTRKKEMFIDITPCAAEFISKERISHGVLTIFVPHTTAGITINESADPSVVEDILSSIKRIVPDEFHYKHLEGNSAAHIKTLLTGSSLSIPVMNGKLLLGAWQGIFFCEYDGPRERKIVLSL